MTTTNLILTDPALASVTPANNIGFDASSTGLNDEQLLIVRGWISSFIINYRTNPPAGSTICAVLSARLVDWARTELVGSPAFRPDFVPVRVGLQKRIKLGLKESAAGTPITAAVLKSVWSYQGLSTDKPPALPDSLLELFLPAQYWPLLIAMIEEGPETVSKRFNYWFHDWSGDKKKTTIVGTSILLLRIFHECVNVNEYDTGALTSWTRNLPTVVVPPTPDDTPTRLGNPSLSEVRLAVQAQISELCELVGTSAKRDSVGFGELLGAIASIPDTRFEKTEDALFTTCRSWAILHTLWVIQARRGSLERIKVKHVGDLLTGAGFGPTLSHIPGKSLPEDHIVEKPLSPKAHYPFQVYLAIRERMHGGPLSPDWPLFPCYARTPAVPLGEQAITTLMEGKVERIGSGVRAKRYKVAEYRAAVQKERDLAKQDGRVPKEVGYFKTGEKTVWIDTRITRARSRSVDGDPFPIWKGTSKAILPMNGNPYDGWNPHSLRKTGSQQLDTPRVTQYLAEKEFPFSPKWLSEIVQNHSNLDGTTAVSAIYKASQEVRDRVTAMAVEVLAELLYGDLGARMVPDVRRYTGALRKQRGFEGEIQSMKARRANLRDARRRGDIDADEYELQLDELMERRDEVTDLHAETKLEIERIEKNDPLLKVPLDDGVSGEEAEVNLEQIKRRVLGLDPVRDPNDVLVFVRYWLTPLEISRVANVSQKTANTWMRSDEKRTVPLGTSIFITGRPPIIQLSEKRRVIPVEGLNPEWLNENPNRRKMCEQLMRSWPPEAIWNPFRQERHDFPEWLAQELNDD